MITANDLKVQGIKAIHNELINNDEAIISYRGKPQYAVIDFKKLEEIRAFEIDKAYLEAMEDIKQGKYKTIATDEDLEEHLKQL
jgi:hypothetical protein